MVVVRSPSRSVDFVARPSLLLSIDPFFRSEESSDGVGGKISPKQNLVGHQLGVVSVVTNPTGDGDRSVVDCIYCVSSKLNGCVLVFFSAVVASSALDSHIKIWNIRGTLMKSIDAGPVECWTVALSPDDRHVASGTQGGNINIWRHHTTPKQQNPHQEHVLTHRRAVLAA